MKKKTKTTKKVIKKNTTKKIKKVSSKKKKELIKAIVNPVRYFKVDFGRYGGEVAMGAITKEQFEYWCGKDEELGTYLSSRGFDPEAANKDVPKEAQFDKEFFEFEDICHTSGPEYSDGQTMTVMETDEHGHNLQDQFGNFTAEQTVDMDQFKKLGVKVKCTAEHNSDSDSCKDKYYIFGQYFNKGGWYTSELIKTDHKGFDFKKVKIDYENADGFKVFNSVNYDGTDYYLEEDSTGKSSAFYVMEGDDV